MTKQINDPIAQIAIERDRQVNSEGWSRDHDDEHEEGEIALAAACYATPARRREFFGMVVMGKQMKLPPDEWPWLEHQWKPCPNDRIRELVKAGALIVAEIERLQRLKENEQ